MALPPPCSICNRGCCALKSDASKHLVLSCNGWRQTPAAHSPDVLHAAHVIGGERIGFFDHIGTAPDRSARGKQHKARDLKDGRTIMGPRRVGRPASWPAIGLLPAGFRLQ